MLEWKYCKDAVDKKEEARDLTVSGGEALKEASEEWLYRGCGMDLGWILKVEKFTSWEGPPYKGGNSFAKTKWHEKPYWRRKSFKY